MKYKLILLGVLWIQLAHAEEMDPVLSFALMSPFIVSAAPLSIVIGTGELMIESVVYIGESTKVVIKSSDGSKASILVAGHLSYAAGQSVERLTTSAGVVLSVAGDVIAFIPNKLGRSLIYQAQH